MPADTHPDLAAEQAYVDTAYTYLAAMRARVDRMATGGRNDYERIVFENWKADRLASLSDHTTALVFGRLFDEDGSDWYIGRRHVEDGAGVAAVVDWRARVAAAFYRASNKDSMGLSLRRQFLVDGSRLLGISDDDLSATGALRGEAVLRQELARARTGQMRDIAATIQAEQDEVIRAPLEGVVVVQGGPGTGKTAIGLHRAAFLLFEHRARLARQGVLVVGPNRTFLGYIADVLPSLGEAAVHQLPMGGLGPSLTIRSAGTRAGERVKGDARMAEVIRRAVDMTVQPLAEDLELKHEAFRMRLTVAASTGLIQRLRARGIPHTKAREGLREGAIRALYHSWCEAADMPAETAPWSTIERTLRRASEFKSALDRMWPSLTAEGVVRDLLTKPSALAAAAGGLLSEDEQRALRRPHGSGRSRATEPWTPGDIALVDEARVLIDGSPAKYGHLVVDEAQDCSPMQLRMLARRCPAGSMTILGDLGQATGAWAHDSWDEVTALLPSPSGHRVDELTLGYRVAEPIMNLAATVLAVAAPHVRAPRSVRAEGERPTASEVENPAAVAAGAAASAGELSETAAGSVAIIAPAALIEPIETALAFAGVGFGDAAADGLDRHVTVVDAAISKGLEFDAVVLVEPAAIVGAGAPGSPEEGQGLRLLYVALTRAMRDLRIVHSQPLPEALAAALARPEQPEQPEQPEVAHV